jgi:hypothetical protein
VYGYLTNNKNYAIQNPEMDTDTQHGVFITIRKELPLKFKVDLKKMNTINALYLHYKLAADTNNMYKLSYVSNGHVETSTEATDCCHRLFDRPHWTQSKSTVVVTKFFQNNTCFGRVGFVKIKNRNFKCTK